MLLYWAWKSEAAVLGIMCLSGSCLWVSERVIAWWRRVSQLAVCVCCRTCGVHGGPEDHRGACHQPHHTAHPGEQTAHHWHEWVLHHSLLTSYNQALRNYVHCQWRCCCQVYFQNNICFLRRWGGTLQLTSPWSRLGATALTCPFLIKLLSWCINAKLLTKAHRTDVHVCEKNITLRNKSKTL